MSARGKFVVEFRRGTFFRGPRADRGGTLGEAMRFNQQRHAEAYIDRAAPWAWFNGAMVKAIVALLLCVASASACSPSHWNRVDQASLVASTAALACDWGQTRRAASERWSPTERAPAGREEENVVMRRMGGITPSTAVVDVYFGVVAIANYVLWRSLPKKWRSVVPGVVTTIQVPDIVENVDFTHSVCGVEAS